MSAVTPAAQPPGSQQAAVEAALVLLERMGLSAADLVAVPRDRAVVPTFAEYVPRLNWRSSPPLAAYRPAQRYSDP